MTSNNMVRAILRVYLEAVRAIPQLVPPFVVFFALLEWLDVAFDGISKSIVVFTFWGASFPAWAGTAYEERWSQFVISV